VTITLANTARGAAFAACGIVGVIMGPLQVASAEPSNPPTLSTAASTSVSPAANIPAGDGKLELAFNDAAKVIVRVHYCLQPTLADVNNKEVYTETVQLIGNDGPSGITVFKVPAVRTQTNTRFTSTAKVCRDAERTYARADVNDDTTTNDPDEYRARITLKPRNAALQTVTREIANEVSLVMA
jgi:hypothetical protein